MKILKKVGLLILTILVVIIFFEIVHIILYGSELDEFENSGVKHGRYKVRNDNLLLAYELIPNYNMTIYESRAGGNIVYTINSHGFRDYEYSKEKDEEIFRIIVLGDSVTFGTAVMLEDTYAKKLETILNRNSDSDLKFEVLNFGVEGYSTIQEMEFLRTKAIKFDPDLVIVGFFLNDFSPTIMPLSEKNIWEREKILNEMLSPKCSLRSKASHFFKQSVFLEKNFFPYLKKIKYGKNYHKNMFIKPYRDICNYGLIDKGFEGIQSTLENEGIQGMVVLFPLEYSELPYKYSDSYNLVDNLARKNGFHTLNLHPYFKERNEELYIMMDDVHINSEGALVASEATYGKLKEEKLIPS